MEVWQLVKDYPAVVAGVSGVIGGLLTARWTMSSHRAVVRCQSTINMLMQKQWDKDYLAKALIFHQLLYDQAELNSVFEKHKLVREFKTQGKWTQMSEREREPYESVIEQYNAVAAMLNDRELVAAGIREGIYDEAIFKRWWYSSILFEWQRASLFVIRQRSETLLANPQDLYVEFETLARRWKNTGPYHRGERSLRLPFIGNVSISRTW